MTFQDTLRYLSSLERMGIRFGLDPIRSLLARLGNPQDDFPSVLVAGTNGKGSVSAMTASVLTTAGFRTGLYTSPDLIHFRERIRIDQRMISCREAALCTQRIREEILEKMSYFEFLTAMAFLHFQRQQVDIAVLEVGMGGRLDATNVVRPLVSVITNISLEHREFLGNTLAAIAREKGGIIGEKGFCITAAREARVIETLEAICREKRATLCRLGRQVRTTIHRDGTFSYRGIGKRYERLESPLAGRHQVRNAALALGVIERIADHGFRVDGQAVSEGLKRTRWEGRLEVLQQSPMLLVDGAHNPAGVASLCDALQGGFPRRRLFLLFGVLGDKDYPAMARKLFPLADRLFLTRPPGGRALSPDLLLPLARKVHPDVEIVEKPGDALGRALSLAGKKDLVCVAGSLYLVGEIKRCHAKLTGVRGRTPEGRQP